MGKINYKLSEKVGAIVYAGCHSCDNIQHAIYNLIDDTYGTESNKRGLKNSIHRLNIMLSEVHKAKRKLEKLL